MAEDMVATLKNDVEELTSLLSQVKSPGLHMRLTALLHSIEAESQGVQAPKAPDATPAPSSEPLDAAPPAAPQQQQPAARVPASVSPVRPQTDKVMFEPITTFAWDQGEYNSEWVSVYVELPGVGAVKERVNATFEKYAFDLQVHDLEGKSYRLVKDNLDKEIVPEQSKVLVKKDKVVVKLRKIKGQFGPDHWANLTAKRPHKAAAAAAGKDADPSASIMDMMKDMYEEGDDNMRKIIGESMLKSQQQRGGAADPAGLGDDFGGAMGAMGAMDDSL